MEWEIEKRIEELNQQLGLWGDVFSSKVIKKDYAELVTQDFMYTEMDYVETTIKVKNDNQKGFKYTATVTNEMLGQTIARADCIYSERAGWTINWISI